MFNDILKTNFTGTLTKDMEITVTQSDMAIGKTSIAVNKSKKVKGEWAKTATFINIVIFGNYAKACAERMKKGTKIAGCGDLEIAVVEGKDGSGKKTFVSILVSEVKILTDNRGEQGTDNRGESDTQSGHGSDSDDDTDVPF